MRIFTAVRHSVDPYQYSGGLWSANFYPALRQLGHEIIESQVDLLPASRFMDIPDGFNQQELKTRGEITGRILDEVRVALTRGPIDLFLSYFYNSHFEPAGFDELRRLGIPSVNFFCNSVYQIACVQSIAVKADFSWHAEKHARQAYTLMGARPVWVQMAADPQIYHPTQVTTPCAKGCFIGQNYADRDRWLAALVRSGIPIDIYGSGWMEEENPASLTPQLERTYLNRYRPRPGSKKAYARYIGEVLKRQGPAAIPRLVAQWRYKQETVRLLPLLRAHTRGPIGFDQMIRFYSEYAISLSFNNVWADGHPGSALVPHVRLRDFEAPMCGACYLTGYSEEIEEFYDLGKEVDTYSSEEELVEKTRYYLEHPSAAARLRVAGYRRARADHTWEQRFRQLFKHLSIV